MGCQPQHQRNQRARPGYAVTGKFLRIQLAEVVAFYELCAVKKRQSDALDTRKSTQKRSRNVFAYFLLVSRLAKRGTHLRK